MDGAMVVTHACVGPYTAMQSALPTSLLSHLTLAESCETESCD